MFQSNDFAYKHYKETFTVWRAEFCLTKEII